MEDLRDRLNALEEAFIFARTIDQETYVAQRDKIRGDLALADAERLTGGVDELDAERVLAFAESIVTDADRLWREASVEDRRRLQTAFFPEGLSFDGRDFGTAVTCLAFSKFRKNRAEMTVWRPQRV